MLSRNGDRIWVYGILYIITYVNRILIEQEVEEHQSRPSACDAIRFSFSGSGPFQSVLIFRTSGVEGVIFWNEQEHRVYIQNFFKILVFWISLQNFTLFTCFCQPWGGGLTRLAQWPNVAITQGIATLGQAWVNASKHYSANMRLPGSHWDIVTSTGSASKDK